MLRQAINSVVFAPPFRSGGVKSLYAVCEWLSELGRSTIKSFPEPRLADWFAHRCRLYDYSYVPDVLVYPEIHQPHFDGKTHVCFALGKCAGVKPHADLVVCKSREILDWVAGELPDAPALLVEPSIERSVFYYGGRTKKALICYMTRPHKHPETAQLLRDAYGEKVFEIAGFEEAKVAVALRDAKVFVWRGADSEGSPRPPKEALVAGCVVVGLEQDLNPRYHTDFGVRCSSVEELITKAGEALKMPTPSEEERALVRDSAEEKRDWHALFERLDIKAGPPPQPDTSNSK